MLSKLFEKIEEIAYFTKAFLIFQVAYCMASLSSQSRCHAENTSLFSCSPSAV